MGHGLTKVLKEEKKYSWPYFPIYCSLYALENLRHAGLERNQIKCLKLFLNSNKKYEPNQVAFNFTIQVKIKPFSHEDDDFYDLFESVDTYSIVEKLAAPRLNPQKLSKFKNYRK